MWVVVVVKNHNGVFVAGASHFSPMPLILPEGAEVVECKLAAELAKEIGCQGFILETECAKYEEGRDRSVLGPLIEDCSSRLRSGGN
jgi:hypothetical protein